MNDAMADPTSTHTQKQPLAKKSNAQHQRPKQKVALFHAS